MSVDLWTTNYPTLSQNSIKKAKQTSYNTQFERGEVRKLWGSSSLWYLRNPESSQTHIVMLLTKAWLDTSWALYWNSDIFGPLSTSNPMMTEYVSWEKALFFLPMERGAAKPLIILKLLHSPNCSFFLIRSDIQNTFKIWDGFLSSLLFNHSLLCSNSLHVEYSSLCLHVLKIFLVYNFFFKEFCLLYPGLCIVY